MPCYDGRIDERFEGDHAIKGIELLCAFCSKQSATRLRQLGLYAWYIKHLNYDLEYASTATEQGNYQEKLDLLEIQQRHAPKETFCSECFAPVCEHVCRTIYNLSRTPKGTNEQK